MDPCISVTTYAWSARYGLVFSSLIIVLIVNLVSSEELENVNRGIMRERGRLAAMYSREQWPAFGVC
jgi:hypothetical protein